jgi:hypothetical protein
MISRGVTGDADNQLTSVLQRKHPHELLDSVVKERWVDSFVSTEARILQRPLYLSSGYFKKFSKFPLQLQPLALRLTWRLTLAGGEFYSVTTCCQPPFSPLPNPP